jgi:trimethylamine--corrinoid protein Co-methyltransferase
MAFRSCVAAPYKPVSDGAIQQIHQASLGVLEELGVKFCDPEALRFLQEHGCNVDHGRQVARIPHSLVEACLQASPSEFRLRARNPNYDILFDAGSVHFSACSGMKVLDVETMSRRPAMFKDAEDAATLCDALENIAGSNTGLGWIEDRPVETNLEWLYAAAIRNSEKVTSVAVMNDSEIWGIRMAQAAGEDIIVAVSSMSPLSWAQDQITGARRAILAGLPLGIQSMACMGVTAPATLSGTATIMNAEILAMAVYAELLRPGTGLMYSCFSIPMDMRTGALASGSIELGMLTALSAQLSKIYNMGSIAFLPMTDAKVPDEQAGYEKAMQWLLAGLSGINLVWGAGMLEGHALWSNAQLVIDAEMAGMVGRCLDGFRIDADAIALDVIKAVGHSPGSYLGTDHTLKMCRAESYAPLVASREAFEQWVAKGSPELLSQADKKARAILASHHPVPLSLEADREISNLLAAAAKERGIG